MISIVDLFFLSTLSLYLFCVIHVCTYILLTVCAVVHLCMINVATFLMISFGKDRYLFVNVFFISIFFFFTPSKVIQLQL